MSARSLTFYLLLISLFHRLDGQSVTAGNTFEETLRDLNENLDNDLLQENLEYIERVIRSEIFESFNCYEQGKIYHLLGVTHYLMDNEPVAIVVFRDSVLNVWNNCGEVPASELANTIYNIGISYQYTDEPYKAKTYIDQSLIIFEKDTLYPLLYLAQNYQGAGNYYADIHDVLRAETYFSNALSLYSHIEDSEVDQFDILNRLMILNQDFKNFEKANRNFELAISIYRNDPNIIPDYDLSLVFLNGAKTLVELGQYDRSIQVCEEGMSLIDKHTDEQLYSIGLEILGTINKRMRQYQKAERYFNEVLQLRLKHQDDAYDSQVTAIAYENLSDLYLDKGKFLESLSFINKAISTLCHQAFFDSQNNPVIKGSFLTNEIDLIRLLSIKAKIHSRQFTEQTQRPWMERAIELHYKIDSIINLSIASYQFDLSKLQIYELIEGYYGNGIEYALELFKVTGKQDYLHHAYYFSSKSKALILQNQIAGIKAFEAIATPSMLEEENSLIERLNDLRESIGFKQNSQDSLLREYALAQLELELFIKELEANNQDYFNLKHAYFNPIDVKEIQGKLQQNQVILEYFFGEKELYSFWMTKSDFFHLKHGLDNTVRMELDSFLSVFHDPMKSYPYEIASRIYDYLLKSGLDKTPGQNERIYIIPDGVLHNLPFEALVSSSNDQDAFLVQHHPITVSYAASFLFNNENNGSDHSYMGFGTDYSDHMSNKLIEKAIIPGEVFLSSFDLVSHEIGGAAEIFKGRQFLNRDASKSNFLKYAGEANILHLSLHGLVDYDDPSKSCIIFDDRQSDFVLGSLDLYTLKLNSPLVILSSCNSASGKIYRGEGVQGMSRAFLLSGASNVVSSLWSATERSSAEILLPFLKLIKSGTPKDKALRDAKLEYLTNASPSQRHPFYWANYILIGELSDGSTSNSTLAIVAILTFILLLVIRQIISHKKV